MPMHKPEYVPAASELRLDADGAEHLPAVLSGMELTSLRVLADAILKDGSGARVFGGAALRDVLGPEGNVGRLARAVLGAAARPVRVVMFDKTVAANWAVPWHQDRAIAVRARIEGRDLAHGRSRPAYRTSSRRSTSSPA